MKRILSLALVLVMLVSVMPMALAANCEDGKHTLVDNPDGEGYVAATCTTAGVMPRKCSNDGCEYTTTIEIPAPGHDFSDGAETCKRENCNVKRYSVSISGTTQLVLGDSEKKSSQLSAAVTDNSDNTPVSGAVVSWSSSDPTKVSVSESGVVTAVAATNGVTITATYAEKYSGTTTVVVTGYTVAIDATATVNYASTTPVTLKATVTAPDGSAVTNPGANLTWYVETNDYITIDAATGKITVKKAPADSVTVKAYAKYTNAGVEYVSNACVVTVSANDFYIDQKPVNHSGTGSVTLNPALKAFNAGTTVPSNVKFTCEVSGATVEGMTIKSNSLGLFNVTITATWEGGKLSTVVPVSFYGEYDFGVTANKTKFHLEEDNVLTDWKSGSSYLTTYNNQSVYDVLVGLSSNAAYVRLWTSSSSTASGKLSSTSFIDYETKGTLLYASKLSPITFEQIVGRTGDAIIYFELGNTTTDSSNYVVVGKGSINVAFGESKSDIVYNTSKEKAVSVNENDFYKLLHLWRNRNALLCGIWRRLQCPGSGRAVYVQYDFHAEVCDRCDGFLL